MKREIKFRAWDKIAMQFAPLSNKFINLDSGVVFENCREGFDALDELTCTKRLILMQYTGLKDKNGKEIYEGDIIQGTNDNWYNDTKTTSKIKVEWNEEIGGFSPFCEYDSDCATGTNSADTIVIGNIYENPNLLE